MWEDDPLRPMITSQRDVLLKLYPAGLLDLVEEGYISGTARIASPTGQYLAHILASSI